VTGSRVSTKVAQAPGGASSISLGGDDRGPAPTTGRKLFAQASASSVQLGDEGSSNKDNKTSVKVANAPGGGSSIQLGDDSTGRPNKDDDGSRPKKFTAGRKQLAPAGGHSSGIFNDGTANQKTSVRTAQAPGGKSSLNLGSDAPSPTAAAAAAAAGKDDTTKGGDDGDDLSTALMNEISAAVYRKGKVKDTYNKLTQNRGKGLNAADLKDGMQNLCGVTLSDAQSQKLMNKFAKDPAQGLTYPEFIKMLVV